VSVSQDSGFRSQESEVGNGIPSFEFRVSDFDFRLSQESE
jgi:hypothetical protein